MRMLPAATVERDERWTRTEEEEWQFQDGDVFGIMYRDIEPMSGLRLWKVEVSVGGLTVSKYEWGFVEAVRTVHELAEAAPV